MIMKVWKVTDKISTNNEVLIALTNVGVRLSDIINIPMKCIYKDEGIFYFNYLPKPYAKDEKIILVMQDTEKGVPGISIALERSLNFIEEVTIEGKKERDIYKSLIRNNMSLQNTYHYLLNIGNSKYNNKIANLIELILGVYNINMFFTVNYQTQKTMDCYLIPLRKKLIDEIFSGNLRSRDTVNHLTTWNPF